MQIPFTKVQMVGNEISYLQDAINSGSLSGDGRYTRDCEQLLKYHFSNSEDVLLTSSCTSALEMVALLLDIKPGDEIIVPSFTFVSSALPFVLRGAKVKFVDVAGQNMNVSVDNIAQAITNKTKACIVVHYAGFGFELAEIKSLCDEHNIFMIEDAAQSLGSYNNDVSLGSIGDLSTISFHSTKNISSGGEGGALVINNEHFVERAHILREKGTNRRAFSDGIVDKYTWVDLGSSFLCGELQAAFLKAQLEKLTEITNYRRRVYQRYRKFFLDLPTNNIFETEFLNEVRDEEGNGHIFYVFVKEPEKREKLIHDFKNQGIDLASHYIPLHSSPAGQKFSKFIGKDKFTSFFSQRLVRLPIWYGIGIERQNLICDTILKWIEHETT